MSDDDPVRALVGPRPELDPVVRAVMCANARAAVFDERKPIVVGRYELLREIGTGGGGSVFRAHDPELDREIAIKLIGAANDELRARALSEGQALARLSHPNVVPVFDVGIHDERVYLVMELVRGESLRQYAARATVHEILSAYRQAAEGLAAAHDAGLVHRDFKPDNAIVGADGRVRVIDFGLARSATDEATPGIAGTPRYMAPEQLSGSATPQSDQFSFCASAYEALYGAPPFSGDTPEELRACMARGVKVPPRRLVPAAWRRALVRGLALDPAARYPSMKELITVLASRPRGRVVAAAFGLAAVAGTAAAWMITRHGETACPDPAPLLAGVWDDSVAATLAPRYAAAPGAWRQTKETLDTYARLWIDQRQLACRATRERHEQPEDLYQRRLACFAQRRTALRLTVEQLARTDVDTDRAVRAAGSLPSLADCATPAYRVGLGDDVPSERARAWQDLELARALFVVGSNDDAQATLDRVLATPAARADTALRAEALLLRGRNAGFRSDLPGAVRDLSASIELAGTLGAPGLRVEGWAFLSNALQRLGRFEEAAKLLELADAALRDAPDPAREIEVAASRGMLLGRQSRYADAAAQFEHALDIATRLYGESSPKLTAMMHNLAITRRRLGRLDEALALERRAFEIDLAQGEATPKVARGRMDIAVVLSELGRYDEALAELERAAADLRAARGERHLDVADAEDHIAVVLVRQQRAHEAIAHLETAIAIRQELAPDAPTTRHSLANLADALSAAGRPAEAEPLLRDLLAKDAQRLGTRHVDVGDRRLTLGIALRKLGRFDEAHRELTAARDLFADLLGADHARVADVIMNLATLERDRRRPRAALALDQQAHAMYGRTLPADHPAHANSLARVALDHLALGAGGKARAAIEQAIERRATPHPVDRWVLARALWATGERKRAVALAREVAAQAPPPERAEIEAWLADKPAP